MPPFCVIFIFMKVALYARVSTHDQQTLPMQIEKMREYAENRKWEIVCEEKEVGFIPKSERLLKWYFCENLTELLVGN